jgi:hypothetical protein
MKTKPAADLAPRFVSYCRVSTDEQGRSGLGLDAQGDAIDAFVRANQGVVIARYQEVESGARRRPPQTRRRPRHGPPSPGDPRRLATGPPEQERSEGPDPDAVVRHSLRRRRHERPADRRRPRPSWPQRNAATLRPGPRPPSVSSSPGASNSVRPAPVIGKAGRSDASPGPGSATEPPPRRPAHCPLTPTPRPASSPTNSDGPSPRRRSTSSPGPWKTPGS